MEETRKEDTGVEASSPDQLGADTRVLSFGVDEADGDVSGVVETVGVRPPGRPPFSVRSPQRPGPPAWYSDVHPRPPTKRAVTGARDPCNEVPRTQMSALGKRTEDIRSQDVHNPRSFIGSSGTNTFSSGHTTRSVSLRV